jgi:hypothetical protein
MPGEGHQGYGQELKQAESPQPQRIEEGQSGGNLIKAGCQRDSGKYQYRQYPKDSLPL